MGWIQHDNGAVCFAHEPMFVHTVGIRAVYIPGRVEALKGQPKILAWQIEYRERSFDAADKAVPRLALILEESCRLTGIVYSIDSGLHRPWGSYRNKFPIG